MSLELLIVLVVLVGAVVLFVTEALRVDLVAILVMAVLMVTGVVTPEQAFSGFSNDATVTIAAMFVLSGGLYQTGVLDRLGSQLAAIGRRSVWLALGAMMVVVAAVSAFVNNTAVVAVALPIVVAASADMKVSPSKLLMPLSFAAMLGGVCTLIGTSTNILVSSIAADHGLAPFGMFELSRLGLVFLVVGLLYLLVIGVRLIPARRTTVALSEAFGMRDYFTEVVLLEDSPSVGKPIDQAPLSRDLDLDIVEIRREGRTIGLPRADTVLLAGDVLRVRCVVTELERLGKRVGIRLKGRPHWTADGEDKDAERVLVEAVVAPGSVLEGRSLGEVGFRAMFQASVLALRAGGRVLHEGIGRTRLHVGDVLLVEVQRDALEQFKRHDAFLLASEVDHPRFRAEKFLPALAIMTGVVTAAAVGLLPIAASATAGAVLMILLGCLTLEEAYAAITWRVIFLLAGVITLGTALDVSGGSRLLAEFIAGTLGSWGPVALVSAFYLITSLLTEVMSNTATAALLAPIAIASAQALGIDARPLLVAVAFAGSASFITPVGYQTNTMIFGPGRYRFTDFARVGAPLNLIFWIMATVLIPVLWPA